MIGVPQFADPGGLHIPLLRGVRGVSAVKLTHPNTDLQNTGMFNTQFVGATSLVGTDIRRTAEGNVWPF